MFSSMLSARHHAHDVPRRRSRFIAKPGAAFATLITLTIILTACGLQPTVPDGSATVLRSASPSISATDPASAEVTFGPLVSSSPSPTADDIQTIVPTARSLVTPTAAASVPEAPTTAPTIRARICRP